MKNTLKSRALSVILAVLMLVSAFAVCVPASAATATETLESTYGKVLWAADFDYDTDVASGATTQAQLANPDNGDSKFNLFTSETNTTGKGIGVSITDGALNFGKNVVWATYDTATGADNTFFDLMYGRNENYTNYYLEFDFTPRYTEVTTNNVYLDHSSSSANSALYSSTTFAALSEEEKEALLNYDSDGDGKNDQYINYYIQSKHRGPSYFTMMQGGYMELFKICRDGYLYGRGDDSYGTKTFNSNTITADEYSEYQYARIVTSYTEDEEGTKTWSFGNASADNAITADAIAEMESLYGDGFTASFGGACIDTSKAYKIEKNTTYNIRIVVTTNRASSKNNYKTYIRVDSENGNSPWTQIGNLDVATKYGTSGTYGSDYPKSIRVTESNNTQPIFDNMVIATFPENCTAGHVTPMVQNTYELEGYEGVHSVTCTTCGEEYWVYDEILDDVFNNDFTKMTANEVTAWKSTYKATWETGEFVPGEGLRNYNGAEGVTPKGIFVGAYQSGSVNVNTSAPYEVGFTVNFNKFPTTNADADSTGVSFFSDLTANWNMLLRMGTHNIDGVNTTEASAEKAWLKMRTTDGKTSWSSADVPTRYLELNNDYKFVVKFDGTSHEIWIDGVYFGTSSYNLGSGNLRAYRLGDTRELEFTLKNYYVKSEDGYKPDVYDIFNENMGEGWSPEVSSGMVPQANDVAGFYVGNKNHGAVNNNIRDKNLVLADGSFAINFDFMIPAADGKVNVNPSLPGNKYWGLLTWVEESSNGKGASYPTMISVGAIDNDGPDGVGDGVFDKYFLVKGYDAELESKILVKADDATEEEKNNQSITKNDATYYYTDSASIYDLTVGEWVNISVTYDAPTNSSRIFINGELIAADYENGSSSAPNNLNGYDLTSSYIRLGDGFSRRFKYNWALKNVNFVPDAGYFDNYMSAPVFVNDYGSADVKVTTSGSNSSYVFADIINNAAMTRVQVLDNAEKQGFIKYTTARATDTTGGTSRMFDFLKSAKNNFTQEYEELLSVDGNKYAIDVKFAFPDRALTADEITALKTAYNDQTWAGTTTKDVLGKTAPTLVRLSKWADGNAVRLVECDNVGIRSTLKDIGTWYYCDKAGNVYTDYITELDADGYPVNDMTDLKVVVDEWTNTFTVYINGDLAYVKKGDVVKKAADLPMNITYNNTSLVSSSSYTGSGKYVDYADYYQDAEEYQAWVDSGKAYAMIPHHLTMPNVATTTTTAPTVENIDLNTLTEATIVTSNVVGNAGDTVDVTVSLANNPGIAVMILYVEYDHDALELTAVTDAENLGEYAHSDNYELDRYILTWNNDTVKEDLTNNGLIATLTFKIKDTVEDGTYDVTVSYDDNAMDEIYNVAEDAVNFALENGSVVVGGEVTETTYEDVVVNHNPPTGNSNYSFIRFFQNTYEFMIENLEIEKIKDGDVEYIGSQVKMGESDSEAFYDLRFVFAVDDLYASGISYHVTAKEGDNDVVNDGKETEVDAKVYSSIVAGDKTVSANEYFEGNYFSVFTVEGVKVADADTLYTFTITPYVTGASGTKVATGEVYTVQYNGLGQYVGCSVGTLAE